LRPKNASFCSTVIMLVLFLVIGDRDMSARAETFPSRQVTIISPYQAGGTSDIIARSLARKLGDLWRQTVIVENRPGANGGIGINAVVHAPADGYTLLAVASSALTLNPLFYPKLSYDAGRDLAPVSRTGAVPNVIVINPKVAATDLKSLIALAKSKPGSLDYASQGNGSNGHMTGEMFRQLAGIDIVHIPYKGSAPAVTDLIGGQVQIMFDNLPSVLEQIRAGQLRALAVTSRARTSLLPDVPTVAEAALPGFDSSAWFAVMVAKQTPEPVRAQIEQAVASVLNDRDIQDSLAAVGITVAAEGSAELANRIEQESRAWKEVIAKAGIKPE
jgi:tripartite-type tricarboxylate transporter receptor subunit TctC